MAERQHNFRTGTAGTGTGTATADVVSFFCLQIVTNCIQSCFFEGLIVDI